VASSNNGIGVAGSPNAFGTQAKSLIGAVPIGVLGDSTSGYGVVATSDSSNALYALNNNGSDTAVIINNSTGIPIYAASAGGWMYLDNGGNLHLSGIVEAAAKDFQIDHPLDPANKYLYHTSVESSEMLNIYTGVVHLDENGSATVQLPDWFQAVNGDFRYQLTAIGAPAPNLHIASEISSNHFAIAGGQPGMKVSWQVSAVRQDAFAKAHPLQVSVEKSATERGYYIHPELYGVSAERGLDAAHRARLAQNVKGASAHPVSRVKPASAQKVN
jgi:hypothetical protein